jgi:pimeloyl-ACP methyl ester carboxylesterase
MPGGRTLAYAQFGPASGRPLLYFGGSRLEAALLRRAGIEQRARVIGVDRPGIGLSQFVPGRRLADWADDVAALADSLGLNRFAVVGVSGGGPHALACAYRIPERLTRCGVVSGVGPAVVTPLQRMPWLLVPMMRLMGRFFRDEQQAQRSLRWFTRGWPEADRACLADPETAAIWARSLAEAFRQGPRGLTYDTLLGEVRPWGFRLTDIAFSDIYLWHGALDRDVPVQMGRVVAERLPRCHATFYPDEGHLSVIARHANEIVATLTDSPENSIASRDDLVPGIDDGHGNRPDGRETR